MSGSSKLNLKLVRQLLGVLRSLDISLAIKVYSGSALAPMPTVDELARPEASLFWLTAFTSYAQNQSHSGLLLSEEILLADFFSDADHPIEAEGLRLVEVLGRFEDLSSRYAGHCTSAKALEDHPTAIFVYRPEANLVYLNRWYQMEAELGAFLRERMARPPRVLPEGFDPQFRNFFQSAEVAGNPWQAAACLTALRNEFSVITGGPGTGKTTTITRMLCLLMSLGDDMRPQRVRMVAQTGKAAERMREAFNANLEQVLSTLPPTESAALNELCRQRIDPASTIHRLLQYRGGGRFAHHAGNPVSCDFLIVDEATMVDLELYLNLFKALPQDCRILLLGDKNQLSAVETGNVFSDLTTTEGVIKQGLNVFSDDFRRSFQQLSGCVLPQIDGPAPILGDRVVELLKSYRFTADSEVGRLASMLLEESRLPNPDEGIVSVTALNSNWTGVLQQALLPFKNALAGVSEPEDLLKEIESTRVLCAVRSGPQGVLGINRMLTEFVFGNGSAPDTPIHGLPIIVVRNDKNLGLWNGDCGVFFRDSDTGQMGAYFPGKGEEDPPRRYNPYALPDWEPAFALTIHKSQGSEYPSVIVVLPQLKRNFLTWELVYTGITRGKQKVSLIMPESRAGQALQRIDRVSGLRWEMGGLRPFRK